MCWSPKTKHANCTKNIEHFQTNIHTATKVGPLETILSKCHANSVHYQLRAFPLDILQASSVPPPTSAVKSQQQ